MFNINHIKLGPKMIGAFVVVAVIAAIIGGVGYYSLVNVTGYYDRITENRLPSVQSLLIISEAQTAITAGERGLINRRMVKGEIRQSQYDYIDAAWERADAAWQVFEPLPQTEEETKLWEEFVPKWNRWKTDHNQVRELQEQKDRLIAAGIAEDDPEITELDTQSYEAFLTARQSFLEAEEVLNQLVDMNVQLAQEADALADAQASQAEMVIIIAAVLSFIVAVGLGIFLSRNITGPMERGVTMMQEISKGHLGYRLGMTRKDEIGVLADTMDEFADALQTEVVGAMQRIAAGDLNITVRPRDSQDEIAPALQQTVDSLQGLVAEANMLTTAAVEGRLSTRGNAERFQGAYRDIVEGVNDTLDAVIGPLNVAADYVDQMARGEIPDRITKTYQGDFEDFKNNLNRLSDSLREMLGNIRDAVNNLSSASAEILAATTQQVSGANEQSSAISQTTTTIDEVKTIVEQAFAKAQAVAEQSQRTQEVSRTGQSAVGETVESMNQIKEKVESIAENILALSEQTQQIGEIIATVNEIASQSNLLALNASVEAARAGEHGKGFAVVAVEVRNLAEQSKQATAQVKTILGEIQRATNAAVMATEEGTKGVDAGVELTGQAGETIQQLATSMAESTNAAQQIVASAQQQTTGIEQIALAMENINQATVQSLSSTRQAEKAAQDLSAMAKQLEELMGRYKFNGNGINR